MFFTEFVVFCGKLVLQEFYILWGRAILFTKNMFFQKTIFAREVFLLYLGPDIVTSPLVIIHFVGMLVPWF